MSTAVEGDKRSVVTGVRLQARRRKTGRSLRKIEDSNRGFDECVASQLVGVKLEDGKVLKDTTPPSRLNSPHPPAQIRAKTTVF